ncbi:SDR family oxidoreductase [Streptococcus chenjunshii]|uniref:SDR family oxidoreductase n=1 Tax=Streptococcus chenjunshii TaxID=2173853 RepID=A0A372KNW7_9STRE|nr:SDR family oxidoreductase [Streptococcus chenjunshii]AXQ78765.1 SDR family oxidoreductase [Streptococcus chenjunshii]RFU51642.1 SDR family oxidoreductase [Streptococcus chenjunshii]RFU53963.1 SDR family oxidoreductase [Streptococcus chenjunshii]
MKVFVVGANGRVAESLLKELIKKGHQVFAGARSPEKVIQDDRIQTVSFDLHAELAELSAKLSGMDAVYFAAGSRGKDLLQTDAFGAVKVMQAAEKAGIKRFIMLSSILSTEPEKWQAAGIDRLKNYIIAKFFADEWLIHNTELDYTILQPGNLVEAESGSGLVDFTVEAMGQNSIPNVAEVLAEVLDKPNTFKKVIPMADGQTPIAQAVEQL